MQQLLLSFISILVHTKTPSIYPPRNSLPKKRNRTSSSLPEVYLIFQPIRFTMPPSSLLGRWALTPPFHPFLSHPVDKSPGNCRWFNFLWHLLYADRHQSTSFPLGSMALCVARTFLPDISERQDDLHAQKYSIFLECRPIPVQNAGAQVEKTQEFALSDNYHSVDLVYLDKAYAFFFSCWVWPMG